jgi:hypothetical protein
MPTGFFIGLRLRSFRVLGTHQDDALSFPLVTGKLREIRLPETSSLFECNFVSCGGVKDAVAVRLRRDYVQQSGLRANPMVLMVRIALSGY